MQLNCSVALIGLRTVSKMVPKPTATASRMELPMTTVLAAAAEEEETIQSLKAPFRPHPSQLRCPWWKNHRASAATWTPLWST